jgi:8-oxo-dGTP pyrophosphatase MutT (NUDIX family)
LAIRKPKACQSGELVQYAALPFRRSGGLQVLLLTSRDTGRWVLPKGWPMSGKGPASAAKQEALEEAGVVGKIAKRAIGAFHYQKRLADGESVTCEVHVFPLAVERQRSRWPEQGQRTRRWFSPHEAAQAVLEPELAALLQGLEPEGLKPRPRPGKTVPDAAAQPASANAVRMESPERR